LIVKVGQGSPDGMSKFPSREESRSMNVGVRCDNNMLRRPPEPTRPSVMRRLRRPVSSLMVRRGQRRR